jgi:hypothetical protein
MALGKRALGADTTLIKEPDSTGQQLKKAARRMPGPKSDSENNERGL